MTFNPIDLRTRAAMAKAETIIAHFEEAEPLIDRIEDLLPTEMDPPGTPPKNPIPLAEAMKLARELLKPLEAAIELAENFDDLAPFITAEHLHYGLLDPVTKYDAALNAQCHADCLYQLIFEAARGVMPPVDGLFRRGDQS